MRKKAAFLFLALMTSGCLSSNREEILSIRGVWLAVRPEVSYIALNFADSTAVFDNRGDTINRFRYTFNHAQRKLVLTDPFGKREVISILKVTDDSLVLNCLWDLNTVQRFYKSKK